MLLLGADFLLGEANPSRILPHRAIKMVSRLRQQLEYVAKCHADPVVTVWLACGEWISQAFGL